MTVENVVKERSSKLEEAKTACDQIAKEKVCLLTLNFTDILSDKRFIYVKYMRNILH